MTAKEAQKARLEMKVRYAEAKGNGSAGVVRKWKRQIRKLS